MALDVLLSIVGFALLYHGAGWLVKGSSRLARSLGIAPIVIGLTVVAFGTSAPELVVSVVSSIEKKSMIAVGNVFGSNICNLALVLGTAAFLRPIRCDRGVVRRDIPIMVGVTVVVLLLCLDDALGRWEGAVLVAGIFAYTILNYRWARRGEVAAIPVPESGADERLVGGRQVAVLLVLAAAVAALAYGRHRGYGDDPGKGLWAIGLAAPVLVFAGLDRLQRPASTVRLLAIVVAGVYGVVLVDSAERIMLSLGVDEKFVGLTIVALGTSLPELATSVVAALRGEMDISVGNLVGSNVFNLLSVLGLAAIVRPIPIPGGFVESGLLVDGGVMLVVSALPWFMMRKNASLGRIDGIVLLAGYAAFLAYLVARA
jgi:cation:H+ antiporter